MQSEMSCDITHLATIARIARTSKYRDHSVYAGKGTHKHTLHTHTHKVYTVQPISFMTCVCVKKAVLDTKYLIIKKMKE